MNNVDANKYIYMCVPIVLEIPADNASWYRTSETSSEVACN